MFETFGEQTQSIATPPQDLDDVAAPAAEEEAVAGIWVLLAGR
jgi:hypothetical protein